MTLPYIYQFTHSILFLLSALTHSIFLPYKMDGKEGQSVDADFWHPVESNLHQHRCSKFLMKLRIIWSNYNQDQKLRLHLVAYNWNQRFAFYVISCCISHHFMLHFTHFIVRITCIARISHISCILHFTHIAHFTSFHVAFQVILCIISCHFIMKIHFILIHAI